MNFRLVNDFVFKAVFGSGEDNRALKALLNAILDYGEERKIVELQILNPEFPPAFSFDKQIILDIRARDGSGRMYNIEMQLSPPLSYINRAVYYLARMFGSQLEKGGDYSLLTKTISISIISDGIVFKEMPGVHHSFHYTEDVSGERLNDPTELHFIELDKYDPRKPRKEKSKFEKWLTFLILGDVYKEEGGLPEELKKEEEIATAMETYMQLTQSEKFKYMAMDIEKARKDYYAGMTAARREGIDEGLQKGKAEGIAEGIVEGQKILIMNMFNKKMSVENIAQLTGLSEAEINSFISQ